MREATLTRQEFDDFVYPAFASQGAENEDELEIGVRIIKKFKAISEPEVISSEQMEEARRKKQKLVPALQMKYVDEQVTLEEDEWRLLVSRMVSWIPRISFAVAQEYQATLTKIKTAKVVSA